MATTPNVVRKAALTTWEGIWYVIGNIFFAANYFAKVPAKKALQDFGLVEMTSAEKFWYVLQCIAFGAGYFAKIPIAKALSELPQYQAHRQANLGTLSN
jgi:predicted membrane channel-forming protein YqfA (hemolysin III family)